MLVDAEGILGYVTLPTAGSAGVANSLVGNGVADAELTSGRAGVWLAKVLMTVDLVLRQAPAVLAKVPTYELLLVCNETGVFERGIGVNGGLFTFAGGHAINWDIGLTLDVEYDCELAGGIKFKPSCCC